jgi:dipeptidyl aminopeptidase/acylaminoacyl peptidase
MLVLAMAMAVPPTQSAAGAGAPAESVDLAAAFGAREYVQQISLSPDGNKIAMIVAAKGRSSVLTIADLNVGGQPKVIASSTGDPDRLSDCHWSTNARLICRIYMIVPGAGDNLTFTRIIAINADGTGMKLLTPKTNDRSLGIMQDGGSLIDWGGDGTGTALMTRSFVPEESTGTMISDNRSGLGVDLVDTVSLSRKTIEQPKGDAVEYISDGHGTVRMMGQQPRAGGDYDSNRIVYFYRKPGSRDWQSFGTLQLAASGGAVGFNPYVVDRDKNVVYGFESKDGLGGLYSVALDGSMTKTLLLSRPDVDVDGLIRLGRQRRVVGATYATDRRVAEFFDPDLKKLQVSLSKALPGKMITFVDASADENQLVVYASSDVDPGTYYLLDRKTHAMSVIFPSRPPPGDGQAGRGQVSHLSGSRRHTDPGLSNRTGGQHRQGLPAIVMPHGGPGARDEWGFDWLAQYFAARGYAVLQPNFRGSTGYGDSWFQKNGFQSWRTAIGDVNDGGRWLQKSGIAAQGKLAIFGWSYGGYAALQSSVLDPDLFKAIVAVAPVTDLETLRGESANFTNYRIVDAFIGHGPHVTEGSPARNAQKIKAPILLFHGDMDRNVGIGESRLMVAKIKAVGGKAELVEFKGLDHQLEDGDARTTMLSKADAFLRASLGL